MLKSLSANLTQNCRCAIVLLATFLRFAFGVWRLAFLVWRFSFGVSRSGFGVWRLAFGVWRLALGVSGSARCDW